MKVRSLLNCHIALSRERPLYANNLSIHLIEGFEVTYRMYKVSGGLFLQVDCDIQQEHNQDNVKEDFTNRFWKCVSYVGTEDPL